MTKHTDEWINEMAQPTSGLALSRHNLNFRKAVIRYVYVLDKTVDDTVDLMVDVYERPDRCKRQVLRLIDEVDERVRRTGNLLGRQNEVKTRSKAKGSRYLDGVTATTIQGERKYFDRDLNDAGR